MAQHLEALQTLTASVVETRLDRRALVRRGAALGVGIAGSATLLREAGAQDATPAAASAETTRVQTIVDAANAFLDTLSEDERATVLFDWTDEEQKARWSNFPHALFPRDGLMWGDLSDASREAWLALMEQTLSARGYERIMQEWIADDVLAGVTGSYEDSGSGDGLTNSGPMGGGQTGGGPGGAPDVTGTPVAGMGPGGGQGDLTGTPPADGNGGTMGSFDESGLRTSDYGTQYYFAALIGTPSTSSPWQWQWGGHHVNVNATVANGNVAFTPSFIGVQPGQYTTDDGEFVEPLGDIRDTAFALVNALDETQAAQAILGDAYIDLLLGPGKDGVTIDPEGVLAADLTDDQRELLVTLVGYYTDLLNDDHAAIRRAEVLDTLDETYFAWSGPTEEGSAAYFRVAGPRIVIEYSPQALGGDPANHIHGIYRDPENDYGVLYQAS